MSEAMPIDFTFLVEEEVALFDLDATSKSDDYDYILVVDLKYLDHLHDFRSYYPLAEARLRIRKKCYLPALLP